MTNTPTPMRPSKRCIDLIKQFEGLFLKPYLCPANVPTIGYGSIMYDNGVKVKLTDPPITEARATQLLTWEVTNKSNGVLAAVKPTVINQNQFDALVSFAYNCGIGALQKSTLLRKVKTNPNDPTIRAEFAKWNKGGGKVLAGLARRRKAESDLYFS